MGSCGFLCVLLLVLGAVTLVGHGLWVLGARILAQLDSTDPSSRRKRLSTNRDECPACRTLCRGEERACPSCGLSFHSAAALELIDLDVTRTRLSELTANNELDELLYREVLAAIKQRRRTVLGQAGLLRKKQPEVVDAIRPAPELPVLEALPASEPASTEVREPLTAPVASAPPVVQLPRQPRRSLGEMLAGFMEERNILWGELVGGLLIVGCSIALVISLWRTLEQIPYFPFLAVAASTAAVFGAGLYTLHHWKLEASSRGLLVIASLLVPLNFLVMAGLSNPANTGVLDVAIQGAALVLFTLLMRPTAKVLVPEGGLASVVAVLGASVFQLLGAWSLPRAGPESGTLLAVGALPVLCNVAATALLLARLGWRPGRNPATPLDVVRVRPLFTHLGLASFALLVTLGFLVYRAEDLGGALQGLAFPVAAAAVPLLISGLYVHRALEETTDEAAAGWRAAGTGVGVTGGLVLLAAIALAWPRPETVIAISALDFIVLTFVAFRYRLPVAHAAALPCGVLAYLTGYDLATGAAGWMANSHIWAQALSTPNATALAVLVCVLALASEVLARAARGHARPYALCCGCVALLSLALALFNEWSGGRATALFALYGTVSLLLNLRWQRPHLTYGAAVLCFAALGYAVDWYAPQLDTAWCLVYGLLLTASLALIGAVVVPTLLLRSGDRAAAARAFLLPLHNSAFGASVLSLCPLLYLLEWGNAVPLAAVFGWLAVLWLLQLVVRRSWAVLLTLFQLALVLSVVCATAAWLRDQAWVGADYPAALADLRSLQAFGVGLGVLCLGWAVVRILLRSHPTAGKLLESGWGCVDVVLQAGLLLGLVVMALWGIGPEVVAELQPPGNAAPLRSPHAYGPGAWVVLGTLGLTFVVQLRGRRRADALLILVFLFHLVPVLAAGALAGELAVASALRWTLALCYLLVSALLWLREPLARGAQHLGLSLPHSLPAVVRAMTLVGALLPVLALSAAVAVIEFIGEHSAGPVAGSVFERMGWLPSNLGPLVLLIVALVGHALRERSAPYVFASGLLLNLAGIFIWLSGSPRETEPFWYLNILCLALGSLGWAVLAPGFRFIVGAAGLPTFQRPYRRTAALAALIGLAGISLLAAFSNLATPYRWMDGSLGWAAWAATVAAFGLLLWDRADALAPAGLYVAGLVGLRMLLSAATISPQWYGWLACLELGAYVMGAAAVVWLLPRFAEWRQRLRLPERHEPVLPWFLAAQVAVAVVVLCGSVSISVSFDTVGERLGGPLALGFLCGAAAISCWPFFPKAAPLWLRYVILCLPVGMVVESAWALVPPETPAAWLDRSVYLLAALVGFTWVYGFVWPRRQIARLSPVLALAASMTLVVLLGQEFAQYDAGLRHTPLGLGAVLLAAAAVLGLSAASVGFALAPGSDPLGIPEQRRTLYVYAAELLLVLLVIHAQLNLRLLFLEQLLPYWPLAVMVLAFGGFGLSEWFGRRGLRVLAEPLQRTGLFLPLLPLAAFWLRPMLPGTPEELATGLRPLTRLLYRLPDHYGWHSSLWFLVGLLYTYAAVSRRSFRWALAAALSANLGLWVIYAHHEQLAFALHPQLWLVPLAMVVLVVEYLNREHLSAAQGTTVRYGALGMLYVSSAADMFIAGVGNSVLFPVILALFAVGGVLLGILLRVRAFLFLGVSFLFLVVFAEIWHAAVDRQQPWVWWASGIVLGAAILALFALFEKRKQEVQELVQDLRQWK